MDMQKRLIDTEISVLESGVWGTIGKYSVSAAKALAEYSGANYGLLCHALERVKQVMRPWLARFRHLPIRLLPFALVLPLFLLTYAKNAV